MIETPGAPTLEVWRNRSCPFRRLIEEAFLKRNRSRFAPLVLLIAAAAPIATVLVPAPLAAQSARIRGRVHEESGSPIHSARIVLDRLDLDIVSDASGAFDLPGLAPGRYALRVEHVGFATRVDSVSVAAGDVLDLDIVLARRPVALDAIDVEAKSRRLEMVGFFKRQSRGDGTFLDDEAMKRHANRSLSDVLAQVGGVRRSMNSESGDRVTIRGSGRTISTACNVQYYVNGIRSEKGGGSLEALRAADIEGIEVYGGASSIPVEFNSGRAMCGAILIWLKSS